MDVMDDVEELSEEEFYMQSGADKDQLLSQVRKANSLTLISISSNFSLSVIPGWNRTCGMNFLKVAIILSVIYRDSL